MNEKSWCMNWSKKSQTDLIHPSTITYAYLYISPPSNARYTTYPKLNVNSKCCQNQLNLKLDTKQYLIFELRSKSNPKIQDLINFIFYSSYKLCLGRSPLCKYRYQEYIGDYNSDLYNKDEVLICNIFFFYLNVRWKLSDVFKSFKINESLINAKSALK
jgi:hypothetical protein